MTNEERMAIDVGDLVKVREASYSDLIGLGLVVEAKYRTVKVKWNNKEDIDPDVENYWLWKVNLDKVS